MNYEPRSIDDVVVRARRRALIDREARFVAAERFARSRSREMRAPRGSLRRAGARGRVCARPLSRSEGFFVRSRAARAIVFISAPGAAGRIVAFAEARARRGQAARRNPPRPPRPPPPPPR
eukprot:31147-Pelagococcus_subviridis.AAC.8